MLELVLCRRFEMQICLSVCVCGSMASSNSIKRLNLSNFGYGLFICLWACALAFGYFQIVSGPGALMIRNGPQLLQADFVRFYTCGKMAQSEDRHKVYDDQVQLKWLNKVLSPEKVDEPPFIQYPPIVFLIFMPLAYFPPLVAYNLWNFLTVALGAFALSRLIPKNTKIKSNLVMAIMIVAAISSAGAFNAFRAGQVNFLQFAAIAFFWVFWFEKRDILAGAVIAITILKPQYSAICLIPALAQGRWKVLITAALTIVLLLAASAMLIGPENIIGYPQVLLRIEGSQQDLSVLPRDMYCLRGPLSWILPLDWAFRLCVLLWFAGVGVMFFAWRAVPAGAGFRQRMLVALTVLWALLFSPHAHSYDMLLVALPAVLTLPFISPYRAWGLKPLNWKVWNLAFLFFPVIAWTFFVVTFNPTIGWSNVDPIGNVLFTCFLLVVGLPMFKKAIWGHRSAKSSKTD